DPWDYLKHVLTELPDRPTRTGLSDLLPNRWAHSQAGPVAVPDEPLRLMPAGGAHHLLEQGGKPSVHRGGSYAARRVREKGLPHRGRRGEAALRIGVQRAMDHVGEANWYRRQALRQEH